MKSTTNSPAADGPRLKAGLIRRPIYVNTKLAQIVLECKERTARRRIDVIRRLTGKKKGQMVLFAKFCVFYNIAEATIHQLLLK
jgi:hypothetical protein